MIANYQDVYHFWFTELQPSDWYRKSTTLDEKIKKKFLKTHQAAHHGELQQWRTSAKGRLCEIIVLDQFSRNIFRNQATAFASDALALALSQEAIFQNYHQSLNITEKSFLYMPFMHSESPLIHKQALEIFSEPGLENNLDFERKHKKIIDQFGRYPHRNEILNRQSTPEEMEFLKQPGSSF